MPCPAFGSRLFAAMCMLALAFQAARAEGEIRLKVLAGHAGRVDLLRPVAEAYSAANPGVQIDLETGGATPSEVQARLVQLLKSREVDVDLVMIDTLGAAQWVSQGWAEPVEPHLGASRADFLASLGKAERAAASIGGALVAVPVLSDGLVLAYRKDLLEKHAIAPPDTLPALRAAARQVVDAEKLAGLRGIALSGAAVESTSCTFLGALWGAGGDLAPGAALDASAPAFRTAFQALDDMRSTGLLLADPDRVGPDRARTAFQSGQAVFAIVWASLAERMLTEPDSRVKDRTAFLPVPGERVGLSAGCAGGWQVVVPAFSANKAAAISFARHLGSVDAQRRLARPGGGLPVLPALYQETELTAERPFLAMIQSALASLRPRPALVRYGEVSEILRANTHAVLGGRRSPESAQADLAQRLPSLLRAR